MCNSLKTDVLIAHSICSCSQCDSKQTAFLVTFCPTKWFSVANFHCYICVCTYVCMSSRMCGFGPPDTKLGQGVLCHSLPSQRAFCSIVTLESFLRPGAWGPGISQTCSLAPLHHAGHRRDSGVAVGRIVVPVCSLMGLESSLWAVNAFLHSPSCFCVSVCA